MMVKYGNQILVLIGVFSTVISESNFRSGRHHPHHQHHNHHHYNFHDNDDHHHLEDRHLQIFPSRNGCETRDPDAKAIITAKKFLNIPSPKTDEAIEIPIQFHVITAQIGTLGAIGNNDITASLSALNEAFVSAGISFVQTGETTFTNNDSWFFAAEFSDEERQMMSTLRVGGATTLNVYFSDSDFSFGYNGQHVADYNCDPIRDGVVIWWNTIPGGFPKHDEGDTLVHMVGHWLGLEHTFLNGCNEPGDFVDDTPPQAVAAQGCDPPPDTCSADDFPDPVNNFMALTSDECRNEFTGGQVNRMRNFWRFRTDPLSCGETLAPTPAPSATSPTSPPLPTSEPSVPPTSPPIPEIFSNTDVLFLFAEIAEIMVSLARTVVPMMEIIGGMIGAPFERLASIFRF